jgi:hypothetical protein
MINTKRDEKKDTSLNNVKLFLEDTFSSGVSIENVFDSLGGNFSGLVFFLQSFEVWLEKRTSHERLSPKATMLVAISKWCVEHKIKNVSVADCQELIQKIIQ